MPGNGKQKLGASALQRFSTWEAGTILECATVAVPASAGRAAAMVQPLATPVMHCPLCRLVEAVPGKVSGGPILKGTRLPAE